MFGLCREGANAISFSTAPALSYGQDYTGREEAEGQRGHY